MKYSVVGVIRWPFVSVELSWHLNSVWRVHDISGHLTLFYLNEVECISIWLEFSEYFFCGLAKEEEEKKPRERENFEELKSVR